MTPQSPILDIYTDNKKNTYWYKKDFLEQKENIQLSNKEKQIKLIKKLQETHTFDISLIDDSHKWHLSIMPQPLSLRMAPRSIIVMVSCTEKTVMR